MDDNTRILTNQAAILNALAEITFRTAGMDQSVCDGLWRLSNETTRHLADVAKAQKEFNALDHTTFDR
jgi:hypothetical protein